MLNSERQAEVSDEQLRIPTKPIYSSWYFIMAHTLWGNSTNAIPVRHFEWQFVNVSILYRDHLIISSNMVVEEARILIRYLSPLSNATISSSRLFYVAPRARGICDVSTVSSSTQDWNLQFIHDRLDGYVPNHIFSTTLASIHRRQSFIFYASHAAEHTWQWKLLPTNGHRLLLRSPSAINFAPKDFLNFFLSFTTTLTSLTLHGGACDMVFRTCFLWDHILRGCTKLHIWTTLQLSQCSRKAVSVCSVLSKSTLD